MFLWSKDASPGWLQQHETNLIARFGNALAIIERPSHKRSRLEVACKSREQARELVNNFGGRLETLPRDWLKRVAQDQRAKPLRIGTRLVIDRLPSSRSGGFSGSCRTGAIWRSPFLAKTKMSIQPIEIFINARRIYHEQKFLVADPINDQVINNSAGVVQQESVLADPDLQFVDIIGQHRVEPLARGRSLDDKLAHMRNVEDADVVSHGLVFLDDAGVLHRHEPAAEGNYPGSAPHMLFV
jgi:hypothetical protein